MLGKHADNGLHVFREVAHGLLVKYLRSSGVVTDGNICWNRLLDLVMSSGNVPPSLPLNSTK